MENVFKIFFFFNKKLEKITKSIYIYNKKKEKNENFLNFLRKLDTTDD